MTSIAIRMAGITYLVRRHLALFEEFRIEKVEGLRVDVLEGFPKYMYLCVYIHIYIYVYVRVYIHIYIYREICVCIYIYLYSP